VAALITWFVFRFGSRVMVAGHLCHSGAALVGALSLVRGDGAAENALGGATT
jgi:hypothetical protein